MPKEINQQKDTQSALPHVLLPRREQLQPVTNKNSTFSDTYFNEPFHQLTFGNKLRVVADLLRQSVLPEYYADPSVERELLVGDCHLTSKMAIDYLNYLGVEGEYQYAMVNRRPFDPPEKTYSKHAIVVARDTATNNQWQLDSAPWMGYGYGTVSRMGTSDQIVDDYTVLTDEDMYVIDQIKNLRVVARTDSRLSQKQIACYRDIISEAEKQPHLRGFVGEAYAALSLQTDDAYQRQTFANKALELDPYRGANKDVLPYASEYANFMSARQRLQEFTEIQCLIWEEELNDLRTVSDPTSLERQLQLAQWIVNERKFNDASLTKIITIGDRQHSVTELNPRFMKEMGLNVAIIKPSAYYLGVAATVNEALAAHSVQASYSFDPTQPTQATGITPLLFSHSLAKSFERAYTGKNTVVLAQSSASELYNTKQHLRKELGRNIVGKLVRWTDGELIEWHPYSMNYLHTTDNPSEAALHALFGYPEYSPMNRWMYPNPQLEEGATDEGI